MMMTTTTMMIIIISNIPGKHAVKELQKQPYWALHTNCGKC